MLCDRGGGVGFGIGFGGSSILTFFSLSFSFSLSFDSLEQLELLLMRLLGGNGSDLRRELSGGGKEPGMLKIGSSLGGRGDSTGIGSSMR